ncbi:MAG: helix-turn-helix domain-containing protein [Ruminococcaceae bacterium]|nr:helix-turn-helix domain-containing protein [Oscillospiraceae bacterium]
MVVSTEKTSDEFLELNSCGIENHRLKDRHRIRENGRVDFHILYIYQGKCTVVYNGETLIANQGDLILFKPNERQDYSFKADDKSVSCYLHFSGKNCEQYLKQIDIYDSVISHIGVHKKIRNLFANLQFEYLYEREFSKEYKSALLLELLFTIGREKIRNSVSKTSYDMRIDDIQKEIIQNPTQWKDVSYYANKCNLSVSRFQHIFKEQTGMSIKEYISFIRIKYSSELIIESGLSVSEIADSLGYNYSSYFIRCFKKQFGQTPNEYKEKYMVSLKQKTAE